MSTRIILLCVCSSLVFSCKKSPNVTNPQTQIVNDTTEDTGKATKSAVYNLTGNRLLQGIHVNIWSAPYNINDTTVADTMTYNFVVLNDSTIKYGNRKLGWIGEMIKKEPYKQVYPNCVYFEPDYDSQRSLYYDTLQNKVVHYHYVLAGFSGGITKAFIDILHE